MNVVMNIQVPEIAGNVACFLPGRTKDLSAPLYVFVVQSDAVSASREQLIIPIYPEQKSMARQAKLRISEHHRGISVVQVACSLLSLRKPLHI